MAYLQAYREEHEKYPTEQKIKLSARMAALVTDALARLHGLKLLAIKTESRTVGHAYNYGVNLPANHCTLGLVLHELAHVYNHQRYHGDGHTGTFKNALGILYHHSRPNYKRILLNAKAQIDKENAEYRAQAERMAEREKRRNEKMQALAEKKSSRVYRIEHLTKRIAKLQSRRKRIETMIRTALRKRNRLVLIEKKGGNHESV